MLLTFTMMLDSEEDKDKLTKIYKKYYSLMLAVAKSIIHNHTLAEDIVSDSFLTLIKHLHKISDIECHKTQSYIVIIVRHLSLNLLKKQKTYNTESVDVFDEPDNNAVILDNLTTKESLDNIISQIRALPKSLSDVLYLSSVLGYSYEEIANLLGISNEAVRKRLSRARTKIKNNL